MFSDTRKFNKEIKAFKAINFGPALHPLKKEQVKQAVLFRLHAPADSSYFFKDERKFKLIRLALPVSAALLLFGGTAFAANNARPGDILFPVKKTAEQIVVRLTPTQEGKAKLQVKFAAERLSELTQINRQVKNNAISTSGSQVPAQTEAQDEVKNALTELQATEANLQSKGNLDAAAVAHQTVVQLQTSLQASDKQENNGGESLNHIGDNPGDNQNASGTHATQLQAGQAETDKKNKGQKKTSGNDNSARTSASDNQTSGTQSRSATSVPVSAVNQNKDGNKDNQDNKNSSQGKINATSSPASNAPEATSTRGNSGPAVTGTNNSSAKSGSQPAANLQNNSSSNSGDSKSRPSNNPASGSQGVSSQNSANQESESGNSGSGSLSGNSGNKGSNGNSDNGGSGH